MKIRLLLVLLSATLTLSAQQDSIKLTTDTTGKAYAWDFNTEPVGRVDIGGGIQYSNITHMGSIYMGPSFSCKVNARYGRIGGLFSLSYQFGNSFNIRNEIYYQYTNTYPASAFYSDARYNFAKVSAAMMVPFFNRTNKKGFALSGIFGLSYYNGLGSGRYISFLDKVNPPTIDPYDTIFVRPSTKFNFKNHNLRMFSIDIMLSATYTFKRFQVFVDGGFIGVVPLQGTLRTDSESMTAFFGGYNGNRTISFNINTGLRYCLYYPWQVKPPKRVIKE